MANGHSHIDHNVLAVGVVDNASKHFPGVQEGVTFEESIQYSISYHCAKVSDWVPFIASGEPYR